MLHYNDSVLPNTGGAASAPHNFAHSAEDLAVAGAPGFDSYLAQNTKDSAAPTSSVSTEADNTNFPISRGPKADASASAMSYSDSHFSLADAFDVINPLQHIPLIGTLYRAATGDVPKPSTQVAGDIAYGGLIGGVIVEGVITVANAMASEKTGKPIDQQIVAALLGSDQPSAPDSAPVTMLAKADEAAPAPAPTATAAPTQPVTTEKLEKAEEKPAAAKLITPAAPSYQLADTSNLKFFKLPHRPNMGGALQTTAVKRIDEVDERPNQAPTSAPPTATAPTTLALANNETTALAAAQPTAATALSKQPYGGVLDPTTALQVAQMRVNSGVSGGMPNRIGNTIYAGNTFINRSYSGATSPKTAPSTQQAQPPVAVAAPSPSQPAAALPAPSPTDASQLGQLMQKSADQVNQAAATGNPNPLPPELVKDMMIMALDKYKAASSINNGAPSGAVN